MVAFDGGVFAHGSLPDDTPAQTAAAAAVTCSSTLKRAAATPTGVVKPLPSVSTATVPYTPAAPSESESICDAPWWSVWACFGSSSSESAARRRTERCGADGLSAALEYRRQAEKLEGEAVLLQNRIKQLEEDNARLARARLDIERAVEEARKEVEKQRAHVEEQRAHVQELESKVQRAEVKAEEMRLKGAEAVETLGKHVSELEEELRASEAKADALDAELGTMRGNWRSATMAAAEASAEASAEAEKRKAAEEESKAKARQLFEKIGQLANAALENKKLSDRLAKAEALLREKGFEPPQ